MDSGAVDLVIGHHAHVSPLERFGDRFVVYGMGNLIAAASHDNADGASREGIVPKFAFAEGADGRFRVTRILVPPTYVDTAGELASRPGTAGALHTTDVAAALASPLRARTSRGCASPATGPSGRSTRSAPPATW